jgi:hypothetical protein
LATQFYADQHGSVPVLMRFVAGAKVELNNDTTSHAHHDDNVICEPLKRGSLAREERHDHARLTRRRDRVSAGELYLEAGLQAPA